MRKTLLTAALVLMPLFAFAQGGAPVTTIPGPVGSGEASGLILVTNVFQQIWPQATVAVPRKGCLVLNNSASRQWVYFQGPTMTTPTAANSATLKATAIPLEPASATNALGGFVSCGTGVGSTLQDVVWITGTADTTFVAKQQ